MNLKKLLLFSAAAAMLAGTMYAGKPVRLMSYNVRNCLGMDSVLNYQRVADVINSAAPLVVAVQELDSMTGRYPGADVLKILAEKTGMYSVHSPSISYRGGKYGHGMLSKEKPVSYRTVPLPCRSEPRSLLIVEFKNFFYCSAHLSLHKADRIKSVDIIVKEMGGQKKPVLFCGDLNAEPDEESIQYLTEFFTPLTDITAPTFPASEPRITIDYILIYNKGGKQKFELIDNCVVDAPVQSDHRPVYVDVKLK